MQPYDIIIAVDGKDPRNWPYSKVRAAFDKDPGERLSLTVNRDGNIIETILVADDEAQIRLGEAKAIDYNSGITTGSVQDLRKQLPSLSHEDLLNLVP